MDQNNEPTKIVFEEEELQRHVHSFQSPPSKIVEWVLKYSGGYVKDKNQANYVLLGFVVVGVIFTFTLLFSGRNKDILTPAQQEQINKIERLQNSQGNIKP